MEDKLLIISNIKKTIIYVENTLDNYPKNEIEFLGFRFYIKNNIIMKLTNKCKNKFKNKMNIYNHLYKNKYISYDEYRSVRDSYIGHLSYGNCNYLLNKYIIYKKTED